MEKRIANAIVKRPAQRDLARLPGGQFAHDWPVPPDLDSDNDIRLALHADHFAARLRLFPTFGSQVLAVVVEIFDVHVLYGWADIGEPPRHPTVMSDNHVWIAGKSHSLDIEIP